MEDSVTLTGVENPAKETGVTLMAHETSHECGVAMQVSEDGEETGIEKVITGDEELEEEVREPRDNEDHWEDVTFQNNVTIAGTLRTKRWIHPHGCMFRSKEKLEEEYPAPERGMWALIGTGFPTEIWICEEAGTWKQATEGLSGLDEAGLEAYLRENDYAKKGDMPEADDFLSKKKPDRTPYPLTVGGALTLEDIIASLDFMSGISGWAVSKAGSAEFESLKVRSFMEVAELIFNRLSALEGDQLLSEGDTIEAVTDNGDGTYTLSLHPKWDGYFTAQIENNILKGIFNDIDFNTAIQGQQQANGAVSFTSWMNVISVDTAANQITVSLYADDQTPAGVNFPPRPLMKFARWGNSGDSSDPRYASRQQCLYLSSSEGRIMKMYNVTKPIPDKGMTAFAIGTLPEFLSQITPLVSPGEDGGYFKTLVAERFIQLDHLGRPLPQTIDRGVWTQGESFFDGTTPNTAGTYERSLVWHLGHAWLCNSDNTADLSNEPAWNSTYWTHSLGNPSLELAFEQVDSVVELSDPHCTLSVVATYRGADVTLSPAIYFDWQRVSVRNGAEDTAADDLWNSGHANAGPSLSLDADDFNFQFGQPPQALKFIVTATLHDPGNPNIQQQQLSFEML